MVIAADRVAVLNSLYGSVGRGLFDYRLGSNCALGFTSEGSFFAALLILTKTRNPAFKVNEIEFGDSTVSNAGYVAHSAFWNADEIVVERIKLATLLYDPIHLSVEVPMNLALATAEMAAEGDLASSTVSELSEFWIGQPDDVPAYNLFSIDGRIDKVVRSEQHPELCAAAKSALIAEGMDADRHYDDYKLAIHTVSKILYWRKYYPTQTFITLFQTGR